MVKRRVVSFLIVCLAVLTLFTSGSFGEAQKGEMAGYLGVPNKEVDPSYEGGFSMYVAAWPLLKEYPGRRFQTGLFGTWMHPKHEKKPGERFYTDIEGGLGWWRETHFGTETPKFFMGGVELNFKSWANGPGSGKGRSWEKPQGKYAVAQLSPWVLWPPDGLNVKQGTCGQLWGYGYLPLPLTEPKKKTAGKDVPTGNNCWTLFLNTGNFKGPVTFFTPYYWSRVTVERPELAGMFLDSKPSQANRPLQMETQHIPAVMGKDKKGDTYARVAPTSFPNNNSGESIVVHKILSYSKKALWDSVEAWFKGGPAVSGKIDSKAAGLHEFPGRGWATWRIYPPNTARDEKVKLAWDSFATPFAMDPSTFGFKWNEEMVTKKETKNGKLITLPQYYKLGKDEKGNPMWRVVDSKDVPKETGLADADFNREDSRPGPSMVTPEDNDSCWKKPGPVAGPFYAYPGDGTKVTYYWYRFADQPAILNADLTDQEREDLQNRVEKLHRNWTKDKQYLPEPDFGELADIDPALIMTPPKGMEVGYVPIATKQEAIQ